MTGFAIALIVILTGFGRMVTRYFEDFAKQIDAPIHCGVEVTGTTAHPDGGYQVETSKAISIQSCCCRDRPVSNPGDPAGRAHGVISQIHSFDYRNPEQLQDGAVLVVMPGHQAQIAELLRSDARFACQLAHMTGHRGHIAAGILFGGCGL